MKASKEYTPWMSLASAILKQAYRDVLKKGKYTEESMYFLDSEWGKYLYDMVSSFGKVSDIDMNKFHV